MYGFPPELDLSLIVGHETSQFCIGPYDLQFTFGTVAFAVQSKVELRRSGELIGLWQAGEWPGPAFYELFGSPVSTFRVESSTLLVIVLANGIELHLLDTSEQYESMQIYPGTVEGAWIV